jgi:transposase, IS30 family
MGNKVVKRMDEEDRMIIQACLHYRFSIQQIATRLAVNKSTISRELHRNSIIKVGQSNLPCPTLQQLIVCNVCSKKGYCIKTKRYYDYKKAIELSATRNSNSRSMPKLNETLLSQVDEIVGEGVRLGQSLHHIYVSNKILQSQCCERTIRRLVYRGDLSIRPHQLRKYVTYKRAYKKSPKEINLRDIRALIGRTHKEYTRYCATCKRANIVHYDSLIGKKNDKQAILTITFPKYNFQFGRLIEKGSPSSVNRVLKKLFKQLGEETVKTVFPINLCDNGIEFSYFHQLETNDFGEVLLKTFYTNPYRSTDKAEAERNHGLIRYCISKGKSLDNLTPNQLDDMFSNLNSYIRKSKGDKTPYDLVKARFGQAFLDKINIRRIQNKKVKLRPIV